MTTKELAKALDEQAVLLLQLKNTLRLQDGIIATLLYSLIQEDKLHIPTWEKADDLRADKLPETIAKIIDVMNKVNYGKDAS